MRNPLADKLDKRICPLCNATISESKGVYHADLRLLAHEGDCSERIDKARRI